MTIGLIILCISILLIFFGLLERFFIKIGIANWLACLLIFALILGAIIPNITIGSRLVINVSGFIIPLIIMLVFDALMGLNYELLRSLLALITVAAVCITVRMLMVESSPIITVSTSLIIGFLGGAAAYLVGQTRMSIISSVMGGIVLGDVAIAFINAIFFNQELIPLGMGGVFNSIIMAVVFGLLLHETINVLIRVTNKKRINSGTMRFEAGEDLGHYKETRNTKSRTRRQGIKKNSTEGESLEHIADEFGEYDSFFDDRLL